MVLPLLKSDLYTLLWGCISGDLASVQLEYHSDLSAVAVVCVSKGYPASYKKGLHITGKLSRLDLHVLYIPSFCFPPLTL